MLHRSLFVVFLDVIFVGVSVYTALGLKYDDWALVTHADVGLRMFAVLVPSTVGVLWLLGLYKGAWRQASVYDVVRICGAVTIASFVGFLAFRPLAGYAAPLSLFTVYALAKTAVANASRMSYRVLSATRARASAAGVRTLIYGAGSGGASALREMLSNGAVGMLPVGFIDDDPQRVGRRVNGLTVLGSVDDLERVIRSTRAEALVLSTSKVPPARLAHARAACARAGARLVRMEIRFDDWAVASGQSLTSHPAVSAFAADATDVAPSG